MEVSIEDLAVLGTGDLRRRSTRIRNSSSTRSNSFDLSRRHTPTLHSTTPEDSRLEPVLDSTTSKRGGLRKKNPPSPTGGDPMIAAMKPLTDEERQQWKGWVELESNPELFSYILRQYGTKDVKVQEVYSLDDETLRQPVHGLIFLYRYQEDDDEEGKEMKEPAPSSNHVWFANQTITNACATIALLNIVMNVPAIDIGETLSLFKTETQALPPPFRGQKLGQHNFIRSIHNSFARRMDMLNADLALLNEMDAWNRAKNRIKKKIVAKPQQKPKKNLEEDLGFHYVAYVPIAGSVWKLDGLQQTPVKIGDYEENWLTVARNHISVHIAQHADEGVNYNLLSLCRSPLCIIPGKLAENIRTVKTVEDIISTQSPDWKLFLNEEEPLTLDLELNVNFGLTQDIIDQSNASEVAQQLNLECLSPSELADVRRKWINDQTKLQVEFMEEAALIGQQDEEAQRRKHDYTPMIYKSVKKLAEAGVLKEIVQDLRATNQ